MMISQYPSNTLRVNPGGPAVSMRNRPYPNNIPDPEQRGYVTRYGSLDNTARAQLITDAFADPKVIQWKTDHAITGPDWDALLTLIKTSIAPSSSQNFLTEMQMASVEALDTATITGVAA